MGNENIYELDPVFEIMGLNYVCTHLEEVKQETKDGITALGYDGDLFYSQNFQVFDEYTHAYQKNMSTNSAKEYYFNGNDYDFFVVLLMLMIEYKDFSIDRLKEEEINQQIIRIFHDVFDIEAEVKPIMKLEEMIEFLDRTSIEDNSKWKLLQVMQQPKKHLNELFQIVEGDMEGYKKAIKSVKNPLDKLLKRFQIIILESKDEHYTKIKNEFVKDAKTYPSLVFPVTQLLHEKNCYFGLLSEKLTQNEKGYNQSKESILTKLKALSDSSKLEIILALKEKPMYNLEIAKQLGLSAATMSHHMNVLLYCDFVTVEKKDGKVYYSILEDKIQSFIRELKSLILK